MKNILVPVIKLSSNLALKLAVINVNSTCMAIAHQPKLPEAMLKYKK